MPNDRPTEPDPELTLRVRPTEERPSAAEVNETLARLGIDVEWSEEAVDQLLEAAAAANEYLGAHPDQRAALARDPEALLRKLSDGGVLKSAPDALRAALEATRKKTGKKEAPHTFVDLTKVVLELEPEQTKA